MYISIKCSYMFVELLFYSIIWASEYMRMSLRSIIHYLTTTISTNESCKRMHGAKRSKRLKNRLKWFRSWNKLVKGQNCCSVDKKIENTLTKRKLMNFDGFLHISMIDKNQRSIDELKMSLMRYQKSCDLKKCSVSVEQMSNGRATIFHRNRPPSVKGKGGDSIAHYETKFLGESKPRGLTKEILVSYWLVTISTAFRSSIFDSRLNFIPTTCIVNFYRMFRSDFSW